MGEAQEVASWPSRSSGFWDFLLMWVKILPEATELLGIGPVLAWHVPQFPGPNSTSEKSE